MATLYNQATNLQAQGKFAPGVSYRADIKNPKKYLIDMPDVKASFNIDLKPIADSMNYAARAQALAKKESDKELLKVQKAEFLNNVAASLMENELAADQGAIDYATVDIKNREVISRALKEGAIYQVDPSDIHAIYPHYGASTFQATKDRLNWNESIREDEQERAKKLRESVPETRNLPYQSQVYIANLMDNAAANTEASYKKALQTNSEADMATAQMYADTMAYNQGASTFSNILSGLGSGKITGSEAQAQVEQSVFQSLNGRISDQMRLEITKRAMERLKPTIETYSKMVPEEVDLYKSLMDYQKRRITTNWLSTHSNDAVAWAMNALDPTLFMLSLNNDDNEAYTYQRIPARTYTENGRTITVPESQGGIISVKSATGDVYNFDQPIDKNLASRYRSGFLNLTQRAGELQLPRAPYTKEMLQRSYDLDSRQQSVLLPSADYVRNMSPDDQKVHLENRKRLDQMTNKNQTYRNNIESNGNTEQLKQMDYESSRTLGEEIVIGQNRFKDVIDWASTSSKLNSIEYLKPYIRVSKEGHLLLKDDVQGVFQSIAQTFTGKDVKELLNTFNQHLDTFCISPQEKRAVIDFELSGLGQIEEWDGSTGYSTNPTAIETLGSGLIKLTGDALQYAKEGLYKGGEIIGEKTAGYIYNNPDKVEAVNKFIDNIRPIVNDWIAKTFSSSATEKTTKQPSIMTVDEAFDALTKTPSQSSTEVQPSTTTEETPKQSSIMTADEAFEALTKKKTAKVSINETVDELKKTKPDSPIVKLDEDKQLRAKAVQNAEKIVQQTTLTDKQRKDVEKMLEDFKEKSWDGLAKWSGTGYLGGLAADMVIYQNYGLGDAMTSTGSRRGGAINQGLLALLIGAGEISSMAVEGAEGMLRDLWNGATLIVERATIPIEPNKKDVKYYQF